MNPKNNLFVQYIAVLAILEVLKAIMSMFSEPVYAFDEKEIVEPKQRTSMRKSTSIDTYDLEEKRSWRKGQRSWKSYRKTQYKG